MPANPARSASARRRRISGFLRSVPVPEHGASSRTESKRPRASGGRSGVRPDDERLVPPPGGREIRGEPAGAGRRPLEGDDAPRAAGREEDAALPAGRGREIESESGCGQKGGEGLRGDVDDGERASRDERVRRGVAPRDGERERRPRRALRRHSSRGERGEDLVDGSRLWIREEVCRRVDVVRLERGARRALAEGRDPAPHEPLGVRRLEREADGGDRCPRADEPRPVSIPAPRHGGGWRSRGRPPSARRPGWPPRSLRRPHAAGPGPSGGAVRPRSSGPRAPAGPASRRAAGGAARGRDPGGSRRGASS